MANAADVLRLRLAQPVEAAAIVELEHDAADVYREVEGYAWVADLPAMSVDEVTRAIAGDGVWVVEHEGRVVGAAVCWWHGDDCHLRELNVHRAHARRGLGRRLVDAVTKAAREAGCTRVVLTTFAEVPFNGPWYERLGFVTLDGELEGWVARERADEVREGLDRGPRQVMALVL